MRILGTLIVLLVVAVVLVIGGAAGLAWTNTLQVATWGRIRRTEGPQQTPPIQP